MHKDRGACSVPDLKEGLLTKAVVPSPLPHPFSKFADVWKKFARRIDGHEVLLDYPRAMTFYPYIGDSIDVQGWFLKTHHRKGWGSAKVWLPLGWFDLSYTRQGSLFL